MRRRIYVDPEGDLCDDTTRAYLFHERDGIHGAAFRVCDRGALYDEELWSRYLEACERANDLRMKVLDSLIREPYDAVELEAKRRMQSDLGIAEVRRIEAELLAHAATKERPP